MGQQKYNAISTGSAVYPAYTQLWGTAVLTFGSEAKTLIHDGVTEWSEDSLITTADASIFKKSTGSNRIIEFNANTDNAYLNYSATPQDYSSFMGFKIWTRCDSVVGNLRLEFVDGSGYTARVDFNPYLTWVKGNITEMTCNEWVLSKFQIKTFILSNSSFDWADIDYIKIYTREFSSTTAYWIGPLYGSGSGNLKGWYDGDDMIWDELDLGRPQTKPAGTAAAEGGAGSIAAGTYTYMICHVNNQVDPPQRGPLSPTFAVTTVANDKEIDITGIPDPNDTQNIHKIDIFRTLNGGTAYYYLNTINEGVATYEDNTTDATLSAHEQLDARYVQNSSEFPDCKYCLACASRIFMTGDPEYPKRFYWSELDKPCEMYGNNWYPLQVVGNDEATGMFEIDNTLYITTNKTVFRISNLFSDPWNWKRDDLETGVGCVGHRTIQKVGLGLGNQAVACFLSDYPLNVYLFDGNTCHPIGDKILPKIKATHNTLRPYCPSATDGEKQRYILGLANEGTTDAWDKYYAYDFTLSRKRGSPQWLPFDIHSFTALGTTAAGGEGYLLDGSESGYIFERDDDFQNDIPTEFNEKSIWAIGAGTVKSISGNVFTLNAQGANNFTTNVLKGYFVYCSAGTGKGSWGEMTASTWVMNTDIALTVPSWSGTTPIVGDNFVIGSVYWYYKTKIHDFGNVMQFIYLHMFHKAASNDNVDIEWYIDRSDTAVRGAVETKTIDETHIKQGIPCHARQLQFKFSSYGNNQEPNLVKYVVSYIDRSETEID